MSGFSFSTPAEGRRRFGDGSPAETGLRVCVHRLSRTAAQRWFSWYSQLLLGWPIGVALFFSGGGELRSSRNSGDTRGLAGQELGLLVSGERRVLMVAMGWATGDDARAVELHSICWLWAATALLFKRVRSRRRERGGASVRGCEGCLLLAWPGCRGYGAAALRAGDRLGLHRPTPHLRLCSGGVGDWMGEAKVLHRPLAKRRRWRMGAQWPWPRPCSERGGLGFGP